MRSIIFWAFVLGIAICRFAEAKSYVPIGSPIGIPTSIRSTFLPVKVQDRPFLPGMRPVELELLEDALRRKMHIAIGDSREKGHASIIRNSLRDSRKQSHFNGILAEALFLKKNPNWGYVAKPNAPEVDVYMWVGGQRRFYGAQIKTHASGNPRLYADEMENKDRRANEFRVPDDHVATLREYWRDKIRQHDAAGRTGEAVDARKQFARVKGLGFTMKDVDDARSRAARFALREQYAGYVSLGAGAAMALGPQLWEAWLSGSVTDQTFRPAYMASAYAVNRATTAVLSRNAGTILSAENASTGEVSKLGSGALRGGLRGNAITGMALLVNDAAWSVYENGGTRAFQSEGFYTNLGGGVSALTLGMAVGMLVIPAVTGWTIDPRIGAAAGFVIGTTAGTAGYLGGRAGTRRILEALNPEFLHKEEDSAIADARKHISEVIAQRNVGRSN